MADNRELWIYPTPNVDLGELLQTLLLQLWVNGPESVRTAVEATMQRSGIKYEIKKTKGNQ